MKALESLWKETKERFDKVEKSPVDCYIAFLREVAKIYLKQSRRVFFRENRIVHWGKVGGRSLVLQF
ncbi:MAG: hypothetical protein KAV83_11655 [Desulfobacterales bacterium]|nr:hypothetical protein [Desulfobacterales bacterium]